MNSKFYFAGICSTQFNIQVEKCPEFFAAPQRIETIQVPGMHGDLLPLENKTYSNVPQKYEIWFKAATEGVTAFSKQLAKWLLSPTGYQILEDDYDPEIYRKAIFKGPLNIHNWMLERGRAVIEFDCKPQRFLKSGNQEIQILSGQSLHNPYMPSSPLIQITGNGAGTLTIRDVTITVLRMSESLTFDCEISNAYKGTSNENNNIQLSTTNPIKLQSGETKISYSGGITGVSIIPRWWTL